MGLDRQGFIPNGYSEMRTSIFTAGYVALLIAGVVAWAIARRKPLSVAPFGVLLRRMMASRVNRISIFAIWWWIGWHFFGQPFPN